MPSIIVDRNSKTMEEDNQDTAAKYKGKEKDTTASATSSPSPPPPPSHHHKIPTLPSHALPTSPLVVKYRQLTQRIDKINADLALLRFRTARDENGDPVPIFDRRSTSLGGQQPDPMDFIPSAEELRRELNYKRVVLGRVINLLQLSATTISVFSLPPSVIAHQLMGLETLLFLHTTPEDLLTHRPPHDISPAIVDSIGFFNYLKRVVEVSILSGEVPSLRASTIHAWILIGVELEKLRNYASLKAIMNALLLPSVQRLRISWELVPKKSLTTFKKLTKSMSSENHYAAYQKLLGKKKKPCVPLILLWVSDLRNLETYKDLNTAAARQKAILQLYDYYHSPPYFDPRRVPHNWRSKHQWHSTAKPLRDLNIDDEEMRDLCCHWVLHQTNWCDEEVETMSLRLEQLESAVLREQALLNGEEAVNEKRKSKALPEVDRETGVVSISWPSTMSRKMTESEMEKPAMTDSEKPELPPRRLSLSQPKISEELETHKLSKVVPRSDSLDLLNVKASELEVKPEPVSKPKAEIDGAAKSGSKGFVASMKSRFQSLSQSDEQTGKELPRPETPAKPIRTSHQPAIPSAEVYKLRHESDVPIPPSKEESKTKRRLSNGAPVPQRSTSVSKLSPQTTLTSLEKYLPETTSSAMEVTSSTASSQIQKKKVRFPDEPTSDTASPALVIPPPPPSMPEIIRENSHGRLTSPKMTKSNSNTSVDSTLTQVTHTNDFDSNEMIHEAETRLSQVVICPRTSSLSYARERGKSLDESRSGLAASWAATRRSLSLKRDSKNAVQKEPISLLTKMKLKLGEKKKKAQAINTNMNTNMNTTVDEVILSTDKMVERATGKL